MGDEAASLTLDLKYRPMPAECGLLFLEVTMWQLYEGDCLEVMREMPDGSVDAVITDPPYNIGKAGWDKIPDYLEWSRVWITEASRVLKPQGAFWCFHSEPLVLSQLSGLIAERGIPNRNFVTWEKAHPRLGYALGRGAFAAGSEPMRSFCPNAEYIIYHANDGEYQKACGQLWSGDFDDRRTFIFTDLRDYLVGERDRAGLTTRDVIEALGCTTPSHYFARSQWALPTAEHYAAMRVLFNQRGGNYLRREYDDLRREYDDLRPTWNGVGVKETTTWLMPPAQPNGHPTPKPMILMERIIAATTNEGDTILDPFAGSGTTLLAAESLGRNSIGCELDPDYCGIIRRRMSVIQPTLI